MGWSVLLMSLKAMNCIKTLGEDAKSILPVAEKERTGESFG